MTIVDHAPAPPTSARPRLRRRPSPPVAVLLAATLVLAACGGTGEGSGVPDSATGSEADRAPGSALDVTYATFDGGTANLADRAGRPLVVNFFARWCVACVSEMPDLERVHRQVADEIDMIGISVDADPADALEIVAETGVTYDLGWDPDGEVFAHFGGFAMPTTVLIDADGDVVEVFSGAVTADDLLDRLDAIRS